jgi:hypothetical protein
MTHENGNWMNDDQKGWAREMARRVTEAAPKMVRILRDLNARMSITTEDGREIGAEIGMGEVRAIRELLAELDR